MGSTVIPDAQVCAGPYDEQGHWSCVTVNPADGTYQITGLMTNTYRVEAYAPDREKELYPETPYYDLANPVSVTVSQDTPNINFTLDIGGSISGRVTNSDESLGLGNARICINEYHTNHHVRCRESGIVNPDGTFTFPNLPTGDYRVEAQAPGYITEYYQGHQNWGEADIVSVTAPGDTPNINFTLDIGGSISGHVTENDNTTPITDGQICVQDHASGQWYGCGNIDSSGNYTVEGLPTGTFRVEAQVPDHAKEFFDNKPYFGDHNQATPVNVTAPDDTPNINFSLDPGGTITGTVRDAANNPLGGISVDTRPWGGYGRCTNSDGTFYNGRCCHSTPTSMFMQVGRAGVRARIPATSRNFGTTRSIRTPPL